MRRVKREFQRRARRKIRTRSRIFGTAAIPRLSVWRSNKDIYAQLIDDEHGHTLASVSSKSLEPKSGTKTVKASKVGKVLAQEAKKLNITRAVLDRGSYQYHGRIKALAEGARSAGLKI